jgi:hypothetical protein
MQRRRTDGEGGPRPAALQDEAQEELTRDEALRKQRRQQHTESSQGDAEHHEGGQQSLMRSEGTYPKPDDRNQHGHLSSPDSGEVQRHLRRIR